MDWAANIQAICAVGALLLTVGATLVRVGQLSNKVTSTETRLNAVQHDIDNAHMSITALSSSVSANFVRNSVVEKLEADISRLSDRMDKGFAMIATRIDNLRDKPNA